MKKKTERNELFQASHMMVLISFSIFSLILIIESFILSWEMWAAILIVVAVVSSWIMHIMHRIPDGQRLWIYSILMMCTYFFYGCHTTSVYDLATVMAAVIIIYTMSGVKSLITLCQITYYITLGYGVTMLALDGYEFDSLVISRTVLHIAMITMISWVARVIIDKWYQVLSRSNEEIDQLTEATERLSDFLANVSHELRTPINAVIGLSGICVDNEQDPVLLANMKAVREAGRRVADQISDILDYSEIDRKKLAVNCEEYMLASVLNDLVNEIRPLKPRDIELIIDVDPAIPSVMSTDISKLKKILRHLIMNGLKYTHDGGVYVRLSAIPEEYGVNLFIEVTDTGIGMTEEEIEKVLDRFYQANSGRARSGGGLGLGMAVVSGFVASLGGFMTFTSTPDVGTTVRVSLPQKVMDPTGCMSIVKRDNLCLGAFLHFEKFPHPIVREYYNSMVRNIVNGLGVQMHRVENIENLKKLLSTVNLSHLFVGYEEYLTDPELMEELAHRVIVVVVANGAFALPKGSKVRIMEKPFYCFPVAMVLNMDSDTAGDDGLNMFCRGVHALVVDDEPMNLTVAKSIFKRYGMKVTTAPSGQDAVRLCKETRFDIIFMDHMMPGMDGVETMKLIRSDHTRACANVPIVALTANAVSTAKEMFLSVGFDGFVSKPVELVELERVLKKVLPANMITYEAGDYSLTEQGGSAPESGGAAPPAPAPAPTGDPVYDALAQCGVDSKIGLGYCQNDGNFYKELLTQFATEAEAKRTKIRAYFDSGDMKNYEVFVHALKSTSKMIGCPGLSEKAKALEFAAKEGRTDYIKAEHAGVMKDYEALTDCIISALGLPVPRTREAATEGEAGGEIMEFTPSGADEKQSDTPGDEIMEFTPSGADEKQSDTPDDEIMEFAPSGNDPRGNGESR
jgi:signal transduction histidine kinase/CheY-like chemotaxis protein/HPt (histidine-containing phosphotransfer) domain-containing protein